MRNILCLWLLISLLSVFPAAAWNTPDAKTSPSEQGKKFTADFELKSGSIYHETPHTYVFENAIRLLRSEGKTNWADILNQNLPALADGATYADKYKGRVTVRAYFEVLWGLWSENLYEYDAGPLGGYDHYYNPSEGRGLNIEGWALGAAFANLIGKYAQILIPVGVKFEVNPDILGQYPSAVDLSQEHFDRALRNYRGEDLLWPNQASIYNTFFEAGWCAHFVQDLTVVQHMHDKFIGNHQNYEDQADGLGDPGSYPEYHAKKWEQSRDIKLPAREIARSAALAADQPGAYDWAESDDPKVRQKALQQALPLAEQYTSAILAKLMDELGIPEKVPRLEGTLREYKTGKPIPGAFIFYRERLDHTAADPDRPIIYFLNLRAWDFVCTDQNGRYTLNLRPGVEYYIRPEMPGYKFEGIYATGPDISFTTNGPPFKWTQPSVELQKTLECTWFLTPLNSPKEQVSPQFETVSTVSMINLGGQMLFADVPQGEVQPVSALPLSGATLSPALAKAVHRGLMEVNASSTSLATPTGDSIYQLKLPTETYIEIQLSRLMDLKTAHIIQSPSEIVKTIDMANVNIANMQIANSGNLSKEAVDMANVMQVNTTGIYATPVSRQTWEAAKLALPSYQITDTDGFQRNVFLLSYGSVEQSFLTGENLFKYGILRIPSLAGAQIEVVLASDPGCIGPDFLVSTSTGSGANSSIRRSLTLTTDSRGVAAFKLKTGTQAGTLRLLFKVVKNPEATDIKPKDSLELIVHPPIYGPDLNPAVPPTLEEVQPHLKLLVVQKIVPSLTVVLPGPSMIGTDHPVADVTKTNGKEVSLIE